MRTRLIAQGHADYWNMVSWSVHYLVRIPQGCCYGWVPDATNHVAILLIYRAGVLHPRSFHEQGDLVKILSFIDAGLKLVSFLSSYSSGDAIPAIQGLLWRS